MTLSASSMACAPLPDATACADAAVQVMLEQLQRERVERRLHGAHLRQYVDAIAVVVDHPADAAHLAFDAIEPLRQRGRLRFAMRDRRDDAGRLRALRRGRPVKR